MRPAIIKKQYTKRRQRLGWTAAVFEVCNTYGLPQDVVFHALNFDLQHTKLDTYDTLLVKQGTKPESVDDEAPRDRGTIV